LGISMAAEGDEAMADLTQEIECDEEVEESSGSSDQDLPGLADRVPESEPEPIRAEPEAVGRAPPPPDDYGYDYDDYDYDDDEDDEDDVMLDETGDYHGDVEVQEQIELMNILSSFATMCVRSDPQ